MYKLLKIVALFINISLFSCRSVTTDTNDAELYYKASEDSQVETPFEATPYSHAIDEVISIAPINGANEQLVSAANYVEETPKPYSYSFNIEDEYGNVMFREEVVDSSGTVRGQYGYRDHNGLKRYVVYIADSLGYRATVTTNEPGIVSSNPAYVTINSESRPETVVSRFNEINKL